MHQLSELDLTKQFVASSLYHLPAGTLCGPLPKSDLGGNWALVKVRMEGPGPFSTPQLVVGAQEAEEQNVAIPLRSRAGDPQVFSALIARQRLERELFIIPSLNRCRVKRIEVSIEQVSELNAYKSLLTVALMHLNLILRSIVQENLGYEFRSRSGKSSTKVIIKSLKELITRNLPDPESLRLGKDPNYNYWLNAKYETFVPRRTISTKQGAFPLLVAIRCTPDSHPSEIELTVNSLLAAGVSKETVEIIGSNNGVSDFLDKHPVEEREFIHSLISSTSDDFLLVMSPGDTVSRTFLEECKTNIPRSHCNFVYFDNDCIASDGAYFGYEFKPDNSPTTLLFHNYTQRSSLISLRLLRSLLAGSQAMLDLTLVAIAYRCAIEASQDLEHPPLHIASPLIHLTQQELSISDKKSCETARAAALESYAPNFSIFSAATHAPNWGTKSPVAPKVSIVIPTRNQDELLKAAVESILAKTSYENFEILVVDNQSDEPDTLAYLDGITNRKNIRVLSYNKEFNFAKMHNEIIPELDTDLVLLLNNDTEVTQRLWLSSLVDLFELPRVGVVGNKLVYPDGTIQHAGATGGLRGPMSHHLSGAPNSSHPILGYPRDVLAVTGACLLVPQAIYLEAGGMDERLAVSYNDMDLCLSVRINLERTVVVSSSGGVVHKESKTRGTNYSEREQQLLNDEAAYFDTKWHRYIRPDPFYNRNLSLDEDFSLA